VLPAPPTPGVVQSVPLLVPKLRLPVVLSESEMAPQASLILKYLPFSVDVAVPPP